MRSQQLSVRLIRENDSLIQIMFFKRTFYNNFLNDSCKLGIKIIHFNYQPNTFVTDIIGDDWKYRWVPSVPIFINAPTGTGKNTFIKNVLVPGVLKYNRKTTKKKKVVILSNRVALNIQTKREMASVIDSLTSRDDPKFATEFQESTFKQQNKMYDFDQVQILSYHQILKNMSVLDQDIAFIVLDEFHFFMQDSTFNPDTDKILETIVTKCQKAVRIYMSATPEDAFRPVVSLEMKIRKPKALTNDRPFGYYSEELYEQNNSGITYPENEFSYKFNHSFSYKATKIDEELIPYWQNIAVMYDMERNFDHIKTHSFGFYSQSNNKNDLNNTNLYDLRYKDLVNIIEAVKDKWMVFVPTKKDGEALAKYFNNKGDKAAFVCSESKASDGIGSYNTYKNIIENEKFEERILFTTSVLDNGINIKDPAVKNIAIFSLDKVMFLQMLGRVRKINGHTINLWIPDYDAEYIKNMLKAEYKALLFRLDFDKMTDKEKVVALGRLIDGISGFGVDNDFYAHVYYNYFSKEKLLAQILRLKNMVRSFDPSYDIKLGEEDMKRYQRILNDIEDNIDEKRANIIDSITKKLLSLNVKPFRENFPLSDGLDEIDHKILKKRFCEYLENCNQGKNDDVDFTSLLYIKRYIAGVRDLQELKNKMIDVRDPSQNAEMLEEKKVLQAYCKKYRELLNRAQNANNEINSNSPLQEQLLWVERFELDIKDEFVAPSNEELRQKLEQALREQALSDEQLKKINDSKTSPEEHDKILKENGIASMDKESHLLWKILQTNIKRCTGKEQKQILSINRYLKDNDFHYGLISKHLRNEGDNKTTYWLIEPLL